MKKQNSLGVIVGRFQFYTPHDAHVALIDYVRERHQKVLVLLGYNSVRFTPYNPYPTDIRAQMLQGIYGDIEIDVIADSQVSEEEWSTRLDQVVSTHAGDSPVVLYGGRDSFIKDYYGQFETAEIPEVPGLSASKLREEIDLTPIDSDDYRIGFLHAIKRQYSITDPTVDLVIHSKDFSRAILGRRGEGSPFRFCGGFVDPSDQSLESSVLREQEEEVLGVKVKLPQYICSQRIDDRRYKGSDYGPMTTLFGLEHISGDPVGGDDMEAGGVDWYPLDETLFSQIDEEHYLLLASLLKYKKQRAQ